MQQFTRLGYLVPNFPGQTHIFCWREICALRSFGEDVVLLSTQKPSPLTCRHDFVPSAVAETHYLFPPRARYLAGWAANGLQGLRQVHSYLNGLAPAGLQRRTRQYMLVAVAADLVRRARLKRINHIHCNSCADAAHVLAIARRMGGPPYSLTLHGDLEVYGTDHDSKMRCAEFVCVVGNHLRQQVLAQTDLSENRVFVTCMGVETPTLAVLGTDRSFTPGALHLVTVARLDLVKGHAHALTAIHRGLQAGLDLRYTIAGEGPCRDSLLALIGQLGLEARVALTGTLSEVEVLQLLSRADAFVLPSSCDAWPVSVMEAMGSGLPVITTLVGATPEMINSGEDGFLIPQHDESALLETIALLAKDVTTRRRVGQAARRTAQRRFDVLTTAAFLRDAIHTSLTRTLFANTAKTISRI